MIGEHLVSTRASFQKAKLNNVKAMEPNIDKSQFFRRQLIPDKRKIFYFQ